MNRTILLIPFLLLSCKKEPTPAECQAKYNSVHAQFDAVCNQIGAEAQAGRIDAAEAISRTNAAVDIANNRAAEIEDCCCWTRIPHLQ